MGNGDFLVEWKEEGLAKVVWAEVAAIIEDKAEDAIKPTVANYTLQGDFIYECVAREGDCRWVGIL